MSVLDFGAVADGSTDSTLAFNRAYDYLSESGGTIRVPAARRCYLATEIIRQSGVSLTGDGPGRTCIRQIPRPGVSLPLLSVSHTPAAVEKETIQNLTLDGNRAAQTGIAGDGDSDCIYIRGHHNSRLFNLVLKNCETDGIYVTGAGPRHSLNGDGLSIDHVVVKNSRRNNLSIISGSNVNIRASEFSNAQGTPPESGIDIEPDNEAQSTTRITIEKDVIFKGNRGSGVSVFNQFRAQPDSQLTINGTFSANRLPAINIIATPAFPLGQIAIAGVFRGNGVKTGIGIALAFVRNVTIGNADVHQRGIALRTERVSNLEIGDSTRLNGSTADIFLGPGSEEINLHTTRSLAHHRIGGSASAIHTRP